MERFIFALSGRARRVEMSLRAAFQVWRRASSSAAVAGTVGFTLPGSGVDRPNPGESTRARRSRR